MATPILGADFLRCYNLLVDIRHNRLSDAVTGLAVQGIRSQMPSLSPTLLPRKPKSTFVALLAEFPAVTQPCGTEQPVKHNITHHRPPSLLPDPPPRSRTTQGCTPGVLAHAAAWHHPHIIQQLVFSLHMVPKNHPETGALVVTIALSTMLRLQIATLSHTPISLHGTSIFSKIDLIRAYR